LRSRGWTLDGVFAGTGTLIAEARRELASVEVLERPLAFSLAGWRRSPGTIARLGRVPRYLRSFVEVLRTRNPHVVHCNTLLTLPEAMIAKALGFPVVLHVHELPASGVKRRVAVAAAHFCSDSLVAVSGAVETMLVGPRRRAPIIVARNGVPDMTRPVVSSPGRIVVGTVGAVSWRKGTDVLARAAAIVIGRRSDICFEHLGPADISTDVAFGSEISDLVSSLPASRFRMLGEGDAAQALRRWTIFALPSRQDPFPLATLEAMRCGLPVVASAVGGVPEQITHLATGVLVRPDDPLELARWIIRLADDQDLRRRLGHDAQRHAMANASLEKQAAAVQRAYLNALRGRFAPRRLTSAAPG
jgi:glycosyltransferase involved in cell wall biosynthesis